MKATEKLDLKCHVAFYSVGTWDSDRQGYTPHEALKSPSINCTIWQLRDALQELRRRFGYSAHRFRDSDGGHEDNDWCVLVERTDGESLKSILKRWRR